MRRVRKTAARAFLYIFLFLVCAYSVFPFYYALQTSFKVGSELFDPSLWPAAPSLANYRALFGQQDFLGIIWNSCLTATATVLLSLLVGVTAAFALGRLEFRGRGALQVAVLGVSMFPQIAVLSGLYLLLNTLGLFNNWFGLSLSYLIFTLPFTVWTLTAFMKAIPREIEESAIVDGAGYLQIIWKIFLPLLGPSLVTTGMLAFIAAWNEFLFALTFTASQDSRTIPVAISMLTGNSQFELPFGIIMAASVVVTLPLVAMVMVFQRRIIAGITAGAVKG